MIDLLLFSTVFNSVQITLILAIIAVSAGQVVYYFCYSNDEIEQEKGPASPPNEEDSVTTNDESKVTDTDEKGLKQRLL